VFEWNADVFCRSSMSTQKNCGRTAECRRRLNDQMSFSSLTVLNSMRRSLIILLRQSLVIFSTWHFVSDVFLVGRCRRNNFFRQIDRVTCFFCCILFFEHMFLFALCMFFIRQLIYHNLQHFCWQLQLPFFPFVGFSVVLQRLYSHLKLFFRLLRHMQCHLSSF